MPQFFNYMSSSFTIFVRGLVLVILSGPVAVSNFKDEEVLWLERGSVVEHQWHILVADVTPHINQRVSLAHPLGQLIGRDQGAPAASTCR